MIGLMVLAFPILEIWSLIAFADRFGVINEIFALLASMVLGMGVLRAQGRFFFSGLQASLAKGAHPGPKALHSILIFVGGALLIVPGFFSDILGLLLILPGTRHIAVLMMQSWLVKKLKNGSFQIFNMASSRQAEGPMRDVTPQEISGHDVIDIDPISKSSQGYQGPTSGDSD